MKRSKQKVESWEKEETVVVYPMEIKTCVTGSSVSASKQLQEQHSLLSKLFTKTNVFFLITLLQWRGWGWWSNEWKAALCCCVDPTWWSITELRQIKQPTMSSSLRPFSAFQSSWISTLCRGMNNSFQLMPSSEKTHRAPLLQYMCQYSNCPLLGITFTGS